MPSVPAVALDPRFSAGATIPHRSSFDGDVGSQQIESGRALELANGQLAAAAELGLAGQPQKPRFEHRPQIVLGELGAALIDVESANRRLARRGRCVGAGPTLAAVPRL